MMGGDFYETGGWCGASVSSPDESLRQKLVAANPNACPKWEARPEGGGARVVSVYDGDTLTVLCVVAGGIYKLSVRLRGVDCPELRGRGAAEKEAAERVRDVVRARCLDETCDVTSHGVDKYGRLIVDLFFPDDGDLATFLLRRGLARPYAGEARMPFAADELCRISAAAKALQEQPSARDLRGESTQ